MNFHKISQDFLEVFMTLKLGFHDIKLKVQWILYDVFVKFLRSMVESSEAEFLNVNVSPSCDCAKSSWLCAKFWDLYVQAGKFMISYIFQTFCPFLATLWTCLNFSGQFSCANLKKNRLLTNPFLECLQCSNSLCLLLEIHVNL